MTIKSYSILWIPLYQHQNTRTGNTYTRKEIPNILGSFQEGLGRKGEQSPEKRGKMTDAMKGLLRFRPP